MKTIFLKYGETGYPLHIPESLEYSLIHPPFFKVNKSKAVDYQSKNLLTKKIKSIGKKADEISVGICINDKTRPVPYQNMLPGLLDALIQRGIQQEQIIFFIANGTHLPEVPQSLSYIPDFIKDTYRILNHDCDDRTNIQYLGTTSRSTPVYINQLFLNCDVRIAVGNIEPHHFAGYSGAVKSAAIGLAGRETILENHKLLVNPDSKACNFITNPLRQDIEEIGLMIGLDFCLNSIKDSEQNLIEVLWGNPTEVLEAAMPIVDRLFLTKVNQKFDVVIASAGGYPKDINLYQAQKAVTNASKITKPGGQVILVAECREGSGSLAYEKYMRKFSSPFEIIQEYKQGVFDIGPHKALQFAFIQSQMNIGLFSTMNPALVKSLLLSPIANLSEFLVSQVPSHTERSLAIMTDAVITIPQERDQEEKHE